MIDFKNVRPTYLEVDIDAILYNLKLLKEKIGDDVELMATVKGDFYGLGIRETWKYLDDNGADSYSVATLNEGIELRKLGTKKDILVLGYTSPRQYPLLLEYDIMPAMFDLEDAKKLSELAIAAGKNAKIHIKVDTGMTRIGFDTSEESMDKVAEISKLEGIVIDGIFSHFTSSEEIDKTKSHEQAKMFYGFIEGLDKREANYGKKHLANSAAVIDLPEYNEDIIRNGYNLTGMHDDTVHIERLPIKLVSQFKTEIARVRKVPKGTGVSYNSSYVTEKEGQVIATLPVGYSDGYKRALTGKADVLVNGKRARIVGSICMDQMMIDVTDIDCKAGDEIILFGHVENAPTTAELAALLNTGNIDIHSTVGRRVPRVYIKDGKAVAMQDYLID
ncbi:MAG: alanine racemase [Neofamilia sp.]